MCALFYPPSYHVHAVLQVTVIPVIAKADTMTDAELEHYRQEVGRQYVITRYNNLI